ncbi:MAG: HD-GYP domain-containing protein [Vicinamibacterales bacterium]|jgi:putative nucleotidyltransferase with HDIG domain|nr:hypothetical protein [Acidobacteriota bacterium]MDP6372899.1 HD-GYP domain-containing protein [Vicinamibacterales bacterium]MDP6609973.1 HD-GYP domain-containing protein [Vicinamibacterales bacterium]HAK56428.1 hypothetical protein [Acidobacteriota bacterium]|tara:strand:- start:2011 stop:3396 length:1386 start_codon:yes stop_codon:yes gene_type:complete
MSDHTERIAIFDDLIRRLAAAVRGMHLYAPEHPLVIKNVTALHESYTALLASVPSIALGLVAGQIVVADMPLPKAAAALGDLVKRLEGAGIERITVDREVTIKELSDFLGALSSLPIRTTENPDETEPPIPALPHIRVGRITEKHEGEGIKADMAAIRQLYTDAVTGAEGVWDAATTGGTADLTAARTIVGDLAESATQNRSALVALTAMKSYDNYTFTHMVNVSILMMGQARALGIEGRLLREFGLAALMHDIGKVRTPAEILNKPEKLTDQEFGIMRRHVVDGAEILRQTTEMPTIAPVVALEHHRRLDGSGYPKVGHPGMNLATQLCSIADVYDAMRSQRAYQQAFPTDRILAIYKKNDGVHFDEHLIRRFVQLIGIYPPGNLVKLSNDEIGVVLRVHAPDPHRPKVQIVLDADGQELPRKREANLWETVGTERDVSILSPLDPADYGIDPLEIVDLG